MNDIHSPVYHPVCMLLVYLSIYLSNCQSVCLSVFLSACLYVSFFLSCQHVWVATCPPPDYLSSSLPDSHSDKFICMSSIKFNVISTYINWYQWAEMSFFCFLGYHPHCLEFKKQQHFHNGHARGCDTKKRGKKSKIKNFFILYYIISVKKSLPIVIDYWFR